MNELFADSFYFIALLNPNDQYHPAVVQLIRTLKRPMVTTAWVLTEVADAQSSPQHRGQVHRFLTDLPAQSRTRVIVADESWYARGLTLYGARPDKAWSLTDCISFEVMTELGLTEALTGDHHFEQAGFQTIFRSPEKDAGLT